MQAGTQLVGGPRSLHRVFLAFTTDSATRARLDALAGECHGYSGGRRVAAGKLHLTLLFIGQAREAQIEAIAGLAEARPAPGVVLSIDRLGFFERGGIVWAGCSQTPPALLDWVTDLHDRARRTGFSVERRPFESHITLLRNARRRPQNRVEPIPWRLERLSLYESRLSAAGSEYLELRTWPTINSGDVK